VSRRWAALAVLLGACPVEAPPPDAGIVACAAARDCPPTLPVCDAIARICVGCIPGSCASGICDETKHLCVPSSACQRDVDCPSEAPICLRAAGPLGHCVGCAGDSDCAPLHCLGDDGGSASCR
jgi:hypothetical protein